jgi:predicted nucleic acid-binding protein
MSASPSPVVSVVVTDANIVINLLHVNRIDLLGKLHPYSFVVPEEVILEIRDPSQSAALQVALGNGLLVEVRLAELPELKLYTELLKTLGSGEAACLALAESRGWLIASDERKVFLREATKRIGPSRILNTAGLFVKAIKLGLLTVAEADADKKTLEQHRFTMKFTSFKDVI